jgi:4-hydroxybenzoate polyprenyltransferase
MASNRAILQGPPTSPPQSGDPSTPPLALDAPLSLPLVVDLDGTLLATDCLHEGLVKVAFEQPLAVPRLLLALARGRQHLEAPTHAFAPLDPAALPMRKDVRRLIETERARGRAIHLVTAADDRIAQAVAAHLGLFDSATGSTADRNLKGEAKAAHLRQRFPEGFVYAGGSAADAPVIKSAKGAVLVAGAARRKPNLDGVKIVASPPAPLSFPRTWARLLRLQHWLKNLLVLVPLFLSQQFTSPASIGLSLVAFLVLGLIASGTYILNDLVDLAADRAHPVKRARPLASGAVPTAHGVPVSAALILAGLGISLWLSMSFALVVAGYLALTLAYSLGLKRMALLDTYVVGILLTLRVVAGMTLLATPISPWLISFSIALFTSLAMAKRHAEIHRIAAARSERYTGRGYRADDLPATLAFGIGCALAALLIMLMYINLEVAPVGLYRTPQWLYFIPGVLMSWIQRVWLLAHRGELHDDPVVFALRDPVSWLHGAACTAFWALAARF